MFVYEIFYEFFILPTEIRIIFKYIIFIGVKIKRHPRISEFSGNIYLLAFFGIKSLNDVFVFIVAYYGSRYRKFRCFRYISAYKGHPVFFCGVDNAPQCLFNIGFIYIRGQKKASKYMFPGNSEILGWRFILTPIKIIYLKIIRISVGRIKNS